MEPATIIYVALALVIGFLLGLGIGLTKCAKELERMKKKHGWF